MASTRSEFLEPAVSRGEVVGDAQALRRLATRVRGRRPRNESFSGTPIAHSVQLIPGLFTGTPPTQFVADPSPINFTGTVGFLAADGVHVINADCTGIGYICSSHSTGAISGGPSTCTGNTIGTNGFVWEDFIQVTIVLANGAPDTRPA